MHPDVSEGVLVLDRFVDAFVVVAEVCNAWPERDGQPVWKLREALAQSANVKH